jgi:vacuolar-type H+-ATPase subunit D/Vma8
MIDSNFIALTTSKTFNNTNRLVNHINYQILPYWHSFLSYENNLLLFLYF